MSQQYYYNNTQYATPTSYAGQSVNACYAPPVALPLSTATNPVRTTIGGTYVSGTPNTSAHRSQAPVTYTYPTNPTVLTAPLVVLPGQQATLVAPPAKVVQPGGSFVIANGLTSQPNLNNNGPYTVTTSYFQQIPGQAHVQQQNMAQAVAAAQQANFHAAMAAANSTRGRRNAFDPRFQNFRKNPKATMKSSIDSQTFYCDVCKISCAGPQTYKEHLDGQKHKKRASNNAIILSIPCKGNQRQLRCELCDVTCTGVDAYQAHIRGSKHQKTFKLHQRLGKPIPCSDPLVVKETPPTTGSGLKSASNILAAPKIISTNSSNSKVPVDESGNKVVTPVKDVAEQTRQEEHVDLESLQEKSVPPVGGEYIETTTNDSGKVVQFFCKLCSCKFNDPHAKEMHLKGRRHRLQYKKKVDPSLIVDLKNSTTRNWKVQEERMRQKQQREEFWRRRDMHSRMRDMQQLEYSNIGGGGGRGGMIPLTVDDRHVLARHEDILPSEQEVRDVQAVVQACERALRDISEAPLGGDNDEDDKPLSGSMRVGPFAKGILLKGESAVSLVLLCAQWPTWALMRTVLDKLPEHLQELLPNDTIEVSLNNDYECILVSRRRPEPELHCYIHLTSSAVREEAVDGAAAVQPEDGLDKKRCLDALASLRHTKWFQAKVSTLQPCLMLVRILRDMCERVPTWRPLSSWAVELLIGKVVSSEPMRLSPGSGLRRIFESVASGVLLPGGPGLRDPCEKEASDASGTLSQQDREDITESAQHALRLIAFRQMHKVLDMEPLQAPGGRKRRHSGEEEAALKKERNEAEAEGVQEAQEAAPVPDKEDTE